MAKKRCDWRLSFPFCKIVFSPKIVNIFLPQKKSGKKGRVRHPDASSELHSFPHCLNGETCRSTRHRVRPVTALLPHIRLSGGWSSLLIHTQVFFLPLTYIPGYIKCSKPNIHFWVHGSRNQFFFFFFFFLLLSKIGCTDSA